MALVELPTPEMSEQIKHHAARITEVLRLAKISINGITCSALAYVSATLAVYGGATREDFVRACAGNFDIARETFQRLELQQTHYMVNRDAGRTEIACMPREHVADGPQYLRRADGRRWSISASEVSCPACVEYCRRHKAT